MHDSARISATDAGTAGMLLTFDGLLALGFGAACLFAGIAAVSAIIYAPVVLVRTRRP